MVSTTKKVFSFRLSVAMVARVDEVVGPGGRTEFVSRAIEEKLREMQQSPPGSGARRPLPDERGV